MNIPSSAALAASLVMAALPAHAADPDAYAGAGINFSQSGIGKRFDDTLSSGFGGHGSSEDKTDLGGRIFLGYRLRPNIAVEAGWSHFGAASAHAATTLPLGSVSAERTTDAWFADAVGIMPVADRLDLRARLGAAFWQVETTANTVLHVAHVAARSQRKEEGVSPRLGFGLRYRATDQVAVGLDLETFRAGKSDGAGRSTVTALVASIQFAF